MQLVRWCGWLSANHGNEAGLNVLSERRGLGAWRMTKWVRASMDSLLPEAEQQLHVFTHTRIPSVHSHLHALGELHSSTLPVFLPPPPTTTSTAVSTTHDSSSPPLYTMASLNTSSNGPNITRSYQNVVNAPPPSGTQASSPTYGQWAVFTVAAPLVSAFQGDSGKESVLKVQSTGGT